MLCGLRCSLKTASAWSTCSGNPALRGWKEVPVAALSRAAAQRSQLGGRGCPALALPRGHVNPGTAAAISAQTDAECLSCCCSLSGACICIPLRPSQPRQPRDLQVCFRPKPGTRRSGSCAVLGRHRGQGQGYASLKVRLLVEGAQRALHRSQCPRRRSASAAPPQVALYIPERSHPRWVLQRGTALWSRLGSALQGSLARGARAGISGCCTTLQARVDYLPPFFTIHLDESSFARRHPHH